MAVPRPGNGWAATTLALGVLTVVLCWIPFVNLVGVFVGVSGVATGIAGVVVGATPRRRPATALSGVTLCVVGTAISLAVTVLVAKTLLGNALAPEDRRSGVEAERVPGRVEQHPDVVLRLVLGQRRAELERALDRTGRGRSTSKSRCSIIRGRPGTGRPHRRLVASSVALDGQVGDALADVERRGRRDRPHRGFQTGHLVIAGSRETPRNAFGGRGSRA